MSFSFDFNDDDTADMRIRSAVFQALGAASVCWECMDGTGIFQSDRALAIGEALLDVLREAGLDVSKKL